MKQIASFSVDHDKIVPGMYISRIDGDIITYDLCTRRPNAGDYMSNCTMHSVEHMLATLLRNGDLGEYIIYFGPMGCQTGFYLLVRDKAPDEVKAALMAALQATLAHTGEVFGATRKECGNYQNLSLSQAQAECAAYLKVLAAQEGGYDYAN